MQQVKSTTQMRMEQVPEDLMRLNIALTRLYEHAIRRGLAAEQAEEHGQKEADPGLQAGGSANRGEEANNAGSIRKLTKTV